MSYDVFISYRRDKGAFIARNLQQALEKLGLRVFFDMEELTDGKFNEKLYEAIEQSKNVLFLMTEGALVRCANDGDWVRNELEHVMDCGVNLVPVAPTGTPVSFPDNLPEKLAPMKVLEVSELNLEKLFNESVEKIAARFKDVTIAREQERKEAEEAFLSQARRFKGNDGVIDTEERKVLCETGRELGIDKRKQLVLIEQVEREFSPQPAPIAPNLAPPAIVPRFEVFISYRRDGGAADARLMYERLTKEGYSVSFDMDTLKSGNFNEELLRRIAECGNFIVLLSKGCFDRTLKGCRREDDWMRMELATALYNRKNVVPVMLPDFEFPPKLPPDIDAIRFKNGPKYDMYYLDSFYEKLTKDFLRKEAADAGVTAEVSAKEVVSVDAKAEDYDAGLDEIFGDDAAYWRTEAEGAYHSIARMLPYGELSRLDEAWRDAEENLKCGDHSLATRKYMEVLDLCGRIKPCSIPFATRLVGDGIDTHDEKWFAAALSRAQTGDTDYQYGVGMLYADGIGVAKDSSAAFRWFERAAQKGHVQALAAVGAAYATGDGVEIDYKAAKRYLTLAERKGDTRAMERMGYLYENGLGVRRSLPIAVAKYQKAAERGNSAAMVALGRMLEDGVGMEVDLPKAAAWYRSAVANDSAVAQRKLAEFLFFGKGVDKDYAEAVRLARLASNQEDADAVALLGRAYEEGWGVNCDGEKAKELYGKAADKGSALGKSYLANLEAEAQYRNGLRALEDNGGTHDYAAAKTWFEKAAAQGHAGAMEELGFLFERGLGCDFDIAKAKEWYETAADKGNAAAMVGLGKMYFRGYDGIAKDYKQALSWFRKAALVWRAAPEEIRWKVIYLFYYIGRIYTEGLDVEKNVRIGLRAFLTGANNGNLCCAQRLATSYETGIFTGKSPEAAKRWYGICADAEKNVTYADDMAMSVMGTLYQYGDGVENDVEVSRQWYRRSAALGNVQCLKKMGKAYVNGLGVPRDVEKGIAFLEAAASRGDDDAQEDLGLLYYRGEKVAKDSAKARHWFEKAAALGSGFAMLELSRIYRDGDGVAPNDEESLKWLEAAGEKRHATALAELGHCYECGELGKEQDLGKAIALYKEASGKRSVRAKYEYGRCLFMGIGVERDREKAFELLGAAMTIGKDLFNYYKKVSQLLADMYFENDAFEANEGQFNRLDSELNQKVLLRLGWRFRSGDGVSRDVGKAVACFKAAAERGDKTAQNSLGWMYYKGTVVKRNAKLAYEWTMKAVQNGNPYGMETLFRMYRDGDGVAQNDGEALKWLEVAARNPEEGGVASSELGECYEYGLLGLEKDEDKAFELYYKSSQKTKCQGRYNRGRCHLHGIGTPVDIPRALEWLSKAAEAEDTDDGKYDLLAMKQLATLYREGKVVEKDDAKAQEWQAKFDELDKKRKEGLPGYVTPV